MTTQDFLTQHIHRRGPGPITLGPIPNTGPLCPRCFDDDAELVQVHADADGKFWVCDRQHVAPIETQLP